MPTSPAEAPSSAIRTIMHRWVRPPDVAATTFTIQKVAELEKTDGMGGTRFTDSEFMSLLGPPSAFHKTTTTVTRS